MRDSGTGVPPPRPRRWLRDLRHGGTVGGPAAAGGVQSSDSYASMMGDAAAAPAPVAAPGAPPPPPPPPPVAAPLAARPRRPPPPARHGGRRGVGGLAQLQGSRRRRSRPNLWRRTRGPPRGSHRRPGARECGPPGSRHGCPASVAPRPPPPPSRRHRPPRRRRSPRRHRPRRRGRGGGCATPDPSLSDAPPRRSLRRRRLPARRRWRRTLGSPTRRRRRCARARRTTSRDGTMSTDQYRKAAQEEAEHTQMARLAEKGLGKTGSKRRGLPRVDGGAEQPAGSERRRREGGRGMGGRAGDGVLSSERAALMA